MENHPFFWVNQLEMAIFHSKLLNYQRVSAPAIDHRGTTRSRLGQNCLAIPVMSLKTIINHRFGGLYHLFLVIWGMVYYCLNHISDLVGWSPFSTFVQL